MARGEICTARIQSIAAGGAGVARLDGKVIFVGLSAPGDKLRCRIKKEHKNWAEAEILEILEASAQREKPPCPVYGRCGGCSLQHLNYDAQIEAKTSILKDSFVRIGGISLQAIGVVKSAPFEYRNRFQFHKIDGHRLGLKERKSSSLIALKDCPVAEGGIRKALKEASLSPPPERDKCTVFSHDGVLLSTGGKEQGSVSICGKELKMDVKVFFQSNVSVLEQLIGDLASLANDADKKLPLADVYCGVGTFAAFLEGFQEIDLIEENKNALNLARENVRGKKVNCFALADTEWVSELKKKDALAKASNRWAFMVLDPPREGLSLPLREWLANRGPEMIAYVSCDPATLARDSSVLLKGGYMLNKLTMYDFYPQTAHIESLAFFSREVKK